CGSSASSRSRGTRGRAKSEKPLRSTGGAPGARGLGVFQQRNRASRVGFESDLQDEPVPAARAAHRAPVHRRLPDQAAAASTLEGELGRGVLIFEVVGG